MYGKLCTNVRIDTCMLYLAPCTWYVVPGTAYTKYIQHGMKCWVILTQTITWWKTDTAFILKHIGLPTEWTHLFNKRVLPCNIYYWLLNVWNWLILKWILIPILPIAYCLSPILLWSPQSESCEQHRRAPHVEARWRQAQSCSLTSIPVHAKEKHSKI